MVSGAVLVGGLGLSATYAIFGVGLPCAFRALTGWSCPFCGGTRMGAALLHGDLAAAYAANPLALAAVALLAALAVCWTIELAGGPALRPLERLRGVAGGHGITGTVLVISFVALAFGVLRNLG
jgi:hypothetical protein